MTRRGIVSYQCKYDPKRIYYHLRGPAGLAHSSDLNNGNMNVLVEIRLLGDRASVESMEEGRGICDTILDFCAFFFFVLFQVVDVTRK